MSTWAAEFYLPTLLAAVAITAGQFLVRHWPERALLPLLFLPFARVRLSIAAVLLFEQDGRVLMWREDPNRDTLTLPGGVQRIRDQERDRLRKKYRAEFDPHRADGRSIDLRFTASPLRAMRALAAIRRSIMSVEGPEHALAREMNEETGELAIKPRRKPWIADDFEIDGEPVHEGPRHVEKWLWVVRRFTVLSLDARSARHAGSVTYLAKLGVEHPHARFVPLEVLERGLLSWDGHRLHTHAALVLRGVQSGMKDRRLDVGP